MVKAVADFFNTIKDRCYHRFDHVWLYDATPQVVRRDFVAVMRGHVYFDVDSVSTTTERNSIPRYVITYHTHSNNDSEAMKRFLSMFMRPVVFLMTKTHSVDLTLTTIVPVFEDETDYQLWNHFCNSNRDFLFQGETGPDQWRKPYRMNLYGVFGTELLPS